MGTVNPAAVHYLTAKNAFNTGHSNSMWGDQYNKNANQGLEALTMAVRKDMAQVKNQLAQNQAALEQVKTHLNITG
jgi:hypothetical protein